jgi:hypothetical protein
MDIKDVNIPIYIKNLLTTRSSDIGEINLSVFNFKIDGKIVYTLTKMAAYQFISLM